ncbi:MAG: hypothetical protein JWP81_2479 [Ferruginibacter sp.]|nr:hypothetical protein [Ferruginibacter sp.]
MSIFISYSHQDKDFVDKLATHLVNHRIHVFVDRWEMNVGDYITQKIQQAITDASFLIVVLSKSSVGSDWCKREMNTGLMLELDLKRVVILPVLLQDCVIPLFLKDKLYADFRKEFANGFCQVLTAVASLNKEFSGRVQNEANIFTDFACNCGKRGEYFEFLIDLVEYSILPDQPHTILTSITFVGNKEASKKFELYNSLGKGWLMKNMILMLCAEDKSISCLN